MAVQPGLCRTWVANLEDRFSHNEAHVILIIQEEKSNSFKFQLGDCVEWHSSYNEEVIIVQHIFKIARQIHICVWLFFAWCTSHLYSRSPNLYSRSLWNGDTGDIAGLKCEELTSDESQQYRTCRSAGVLFSCQNTYLCYILTTKENIRLYICSLISSCILCLDSNWAATWENPRIFALCENKRRRSASR